MPIFQSCWLSRARAPGVKLPGVLPPQLVCKCSGQEKLITVQVHVRTTTTTTTTTATRAQAQDRVWSRVVSSGIHVATVSIPGQIGPLLAQLPVIVATEIVRRPAPVSFPDMSTGTSIASEVCLLEKNSSSDRIGGTSRFTRPHAHLRSKS